MNDIGILALQGDFEQHAKVCSLLGVPHRYVRSKSDLSGISGIIIPGGESTTIGKLLDRFSMLEPLAGLIRDGLAVFATCAGTILLAREIEGSNQLKIGLLDISVVRNAYGPQAESFETDIRVELDGNGSVRGVFIRAPIIRFVGKGVSVLASFEDKPVLVRENNMLAATFHPELALETRIHSYFLDSIVN